MTYSCQGSHTGQLDICNWLTFKICESAGDRTRDLMISSQDILTPRLTQYNRKTWKGETIKNRLRRRKSVTLTWLTSVDNDVAYRLWWNDKGEVDSTSTADESHNIGWKLLYCFTIICTLRRCLQTWVKWVLHSSLLSNLFFRWMLYSI